MRQSAVEDQEIDELPPAVAEAFEKYIACSMALAWKVRGGAPRDSDGLMPEELARAEARLIALLGRRDGWRWGNSVWRVRQYGVERVVG
jgi:hypothetical protein